MLKGYNVNNICKKANQTLGYINIRVHNRDLKATAYTTHVRSQLEYASTLWSSYTVSDSYKLESVQRRAAIWVTRDYRYTSSVSAMLQGLNWRALTNDTLTVGWSFYIRSHMTLLRNLLLTTWSGTPVLLQEIILLHTDRSRL